MDTAIDETSKRAILHTYHQEVRNYAAPIYWGVNQYDANSTLNNGTCFAVKISGKIIGITADHVLYGNKESYFSQKDKNPEMKLSICNLHIKDMESRIIDHDRGLDIATFNLTEDEVKQIGFRVYECAAEKWPPPPPQKGKGIVFMGFPSEKRRVHNKKVVEFEGVTECLVVTDIGIDHLDIQIRLKDLCPLYGEPIPPLDRNLGGYSGAPVLVVSSDLGELWRPGGIISKMPRGIDPDGNEVLYIDENGEEFLCITARRVNVINADGYLQYGIRSS
jgi:hypothetical protein